MKILKVLIIFFLCWIGLSAYIVENNYKSLVFKTKEELKKENKKINKSFAVAFGGGGIRGFYHLGVMKALDEADIKPDIITGSSAGSIAAALYSSGKKYTEIEKIVLSLDKNDISDITIFGEGGFIEGKKISSWMKKVTNNLQIEQTPIKLGITVTDLENPESYLIIKGDIGEATQASSSIPGAFIPVKVGNKFLVDGGVLSLVPIDYARALGADIVLGVDIYCGKIRKPENKMLNVVYVANRVQACKIAEYEKKNADFILTLDYEPEDHGSFEERTKLINKGYESTKRILTKLKKQLK